MVKTFIRANLQKNTGVLTATAANKSMDTGGCTAGWRSHFTNPHARKVG